MRAKSWSTAVVVMCAFLTSGAGRVAAQKTLPEPQLKQRLVGVKPAADVTPDNRMRVDVVVTEKDGSPVAGLKAGEFTLLIDNKPVAVTGFSAVEQTVVRTSEAGGAEKTSSEPVELLLVLDMVNPGFSQVGYIRGQVEKFLRMNGGRLAVPTRLVVFTSAGIRVQNQVTLDGNALASFVEKIDAGLRVQKSAMGADGAVERFQLSAKNFSVITESQMQTAGRKLLVWLGPGWPLVNNDRTSFNENVRRQNFEAISMLLNRMREVQVTAYNVRSFADDYSNSDYYQQFLKPVTKMAESDSGDLALGVLAVESGGRVTSPSNDVAVEIASCVGEARAYYTLKFEPVAIGKVGSYHSIEVKVARPDVKVRAVVGYYEEAGRTSK